MTMSVTMEYQIRSLVKTGIANDSFIDIADYHGDLPDKYYVKGAIRWSIGDTLLLTEADWDIVDLLWSLILDGMLHILENESFEAFFPSQPLPLQFLNIGSSTVKITIGDLCCAVDKEIMARSLILGGRAFFYAMLKLVPESKDKWDGNLHKIESIERSYL